MRVLCITCGQPTDYAGTKKCDGCWEIENRLESYLKRGGANARDFVEDLLNDAKKAAYFPKEFP